MNGQASLRHLGPPAIMGVIFFTSSQPGALPGGLMSLVPHALHDLLHIPAYGLLAASLCLALPRRRGWKMALLIWTLTLGYGVFDEWHQSLVPGRTVSGTDLLRDAFGAAFGIALMRHVWMARAPSTADLPPCDGC